MEEIKRTLQQYMLFCYTHTHGTYVSENDAGCECLVVAQANEWFAHLVLRHYFLVNKICKESGEEIKGSQS